MSETNSVFDEVNRLLDGEAKTSEKLEDKDADAKATSNFKVNLAKMMLLLNIASSGGPDKLRDKFTSLYTMPDLGSDYWVISFNPAEDVKKVACTGSHEDIARIAAGLAFPTKKDATSAKNYVVAALAVRALMKGNKNLDKED